ncbi:hypothetical protein CSKR_106897 [Clonorchis sinensis]|uniref:Tyrosine-protein kinase ephrin type A/B receptor-like domain-containing protein n=1 Tax=Clonorchis sinensis TaxID=79923 RepID=A0A8T1N152_CLOSI|nr:hypothetical protein CSKR_106897 [Clonorchis sinensis]
MMERLLEPDLGDPYDMKHRVALENEPYALFSKMLRSKELVWIRKKTITDAEKYRAPYCAGGSDNFTESEDIDIGKPPFYPADGFTTVFVNSETGVEKITFHDDENLDCVIEKQCNDNLSEVTVAIHRQIKLSLTERDEAVGGVIQLKLDQRTEKTIPSAYILIASRAVHTRDSRVVRQRVVLLKGNQYISEAELVTDEGYLSKRCQQTKVTSKRSQKEVIVKFLSWPEHELLGPSTTRSETALEILMKPCSESNKGAEYRGASIPSPLEIYADNRVRIYFSISGVPCSSPCEPVSWSSNPNKLQCLTEIEYEDCTREFFMHIDRNIIVETATFRSPIYSALAIQNCNISSHELQDFSAADMIEQELQSCTWSGYIESNTHKLVCKEQLSLEELRMNLQAKGCSLVEKDGLSSIDNRDLSISRLNVRPRITHCAPAPVKRHLRSPPYPYEHRICPLGYRLKVDKSNRQLIPDLHDPVCVPCGENSYTDEKGPVYECNECPYDRPSTYLVELATPVQCSNDLLNRIRGKFLRGESLEDDLNSGLGKQMQQTREPWWTSHYPDDDVDYLEHLYPSEEYLDEQRKAVRFVKSLTQLTFSEMELFLMLGISLVIAVMGIVSALLILAALTPKPRCPAQGFYGPYPNRWERINLIVYCAFVQWLLRIRWLMQETLRRIHQDIVSVAAWIRDSRISVTIQAGKRRVTNEVSQKLAKLLEPSFGDEQRVMAQLLSRITLDRIVEFAVRDLNRRREVRRTLQAEYERWRKEVTEAEEEAREAELAAIEAQEDLQEMREQLAELSDEERKAEAAPQLKAARRRSRRLYLRAADLRQVYNDRLSESISFRDAERLEDERALHGLSAEDRRAIMNAAPELRAYLRLPRYHSPAFFFLYSNREFELRRRETRYPAPQKTISY